MFTSLNSHKRGVLFFVCEIFTSTISTNWKVFQKFVCNCYCILYGCELALIGRLHHRLLIAICSRFDLIWSINWSLWFVDSTLCCTYLPINSFDNKFLLAYRSRTVICKRQTWATQVFLWIYKTRKLTLTFSAFRVLPHLNTRRCLIEKLSEYRA